MERILITGISGQDGAYLAQLLSEKGVTIFGLTRNKKNLWRLEKLKLTNQVTLIEHNYDNPQEISEILSQIKPTQIYNLAAQSSVQNSYVNPLETVWLNGFWMSYLLEWIRKESPKTKFFQASSGEIFGNCIEIPQTETTKISPLNPYSTSKAFAYFLTKNYREIYDLFCVNGILFNHDSELRESHFFTQKVSSHIAEFYHGVRKILYVGNLQVIRDIGYAPEYVEGMFLSLQHSQAEDYIFSTGKAYQLKAFVEACFQTIGIKIIWENSNSQLIGIDFKTNDCLVKVDMNLFRKNEIQHLQGNPSKAKQILGWESKTDIHKLAEIMTLNAIHSYH